MWFPTPFSRPGRLSNPSDYFYFSSEELDRIISVPDSEMGWSEYRTIFHVGSPSGTFEEMAYFLPAALEYMANHPEDSLEFLTGVVFFASEYVEDLRRAAILDDCLQGIALCFRRWTSAFVVDHYDEEACRKKQWTLSYDNIVQNGQSVSELIDDLWRYRQHARLADELVASLAQSEGQAVQSAWFLEYSREVNTGYRFWTSEKGQEIHDEIEREFGPPTDPDSSIPTSLSAVIPKITADARLLARHYALVKASALYAQVHPTYWQTIEEELDLRNSRRNS